MMDDEEKYLTNFYRDFFIAPIFPYNQNQVKK